MKMPLARQFLFLVTLAQTREPGLSPDGPVRREAPGRRNLVL